MYPVRTSVVIADDGDAHRACLLRRLATEKRLELLAVVEDGRSALDAIRRLRPDLALLDVRMSDMTGADVCATVRRGGDTPVTRVVLMGGDERDDLLDLARRTGAVVALGRDASRADVVRQLLRYAAVSLPA